MPIVRIETRRGHVDGSTKRALLDAVHEALVACFKIPDSDRHQQFVGHADDDFEIPPHKGPRFTIVTIAAFAGRSLDAKRALYKAIADRFEALGIPRLDVFILLHEEPKENWGLRGGVAGTDLELGFDLKV